MPAWNHVHPPVSSCRPDELGAPTEPDTRVKYSKSFLLGMGSARVWGLPSGQEPLELTRMKARGSDRGCRAVPPPGSEPPLPPPLPFSLEQEVISRLSADVAADNIKDGTAAPGSPKASRWGALLVGQCLPGQLVPSADLLMIPRDDPPAGPTAIPGTATRALAATASRPRRLRSRPCSCPPWSPPHPPPPPPLSRVPASLGGARASGTATGAERTAAAAPPRTWTRSPA